MVRIPGLTTCLAVACLTSLTVSFGAPNTFAVNLGGMATENSKTAESADASDTVKVMARGVGVDEAAALKDAYRDAVERAVGLYVDAETQVQNDAVVKDQVLTQSNAYVTEYKTVETKTVDGLIQVRIMATVRKQQLLTKLRGVMPAQTVAVDSTSLQNAFAQMASKDKQSGDAAELLKAALAEVDPVKSLIVAGVRPESQQLLTGETIQINGAPMPEDEVLLRYLFELKLDREKYFNEFVPHLKKTLDQISLSKPKELRLTELACREGNPYGGSRSYFNGIVWNNTIEEYKTCKMVGCPGWDIPYGSRGELPFVSLNGKSQLPGFLDKLHVYSATIDGQNYAWKFDRQRWSPKAGGSFSWADVQLLNAGFNERYSKSKVVFCLLTSLNAAGTNGKVTMYEIDKKTVDVLNTWIQDRVCCPDQWGKGAVPRKKSIYTILLLDKNGEELETFPWEVANNWLINLKVAEMPNAGWVYCSPFVGCFGESYIEWRNFRLKKDILPKIAQIKIELAE